MKKEQLDRISELTRISRERELTAAEQTERQALSQMYIAEIKSSLTGNLDNTYIVDEEGNKESLKLKREKNLQKKQN